MEATLPDVLEFMRNADEEDLKRIAKEHKARRDYLDRLAALDFTIGDVVEFNGKKHEKLRGTVVKINRKTISVRVISGRGIVKWSVPPSFLAVVSDNEE